MEYNKVLRDMDYTGRNVLITGAASGSGAGIAMRFAEAGANVAFTYNHNEDAAKDRAEAFSAFGGKVKAYHLDQRDAESVEKVLNEVKQDFGTIDVLVNNAGIYPAESLLDISPKDWDEMMEVNARGVFFACQAAAKIMKEQETGGSIVNISSINASLPNDMIVHYGASKSAVEFLTKGMAHDWGKYGIRVNCIAPGLINAESIEERIPNWVSSYRERAPLGRLVEPEDLGNTALFLGSPLASCITGQIITVDGGVLLAPAFDLSL